MIIVIIAMLTYCIFLTVYLSRAFEKNKLLMFYISDYVDLVNKWIDASYKISENKGSEYSECVKLFDKRLDRFKEFIVVLNKCHREAVKIMEEYDGKYKD